MFPLKQKTNIWSSRLSGQPLDGFTNRTSALDRLQDPQRNNNHVSPETVSTSSNEVCPTVQLPDNDDWSDDLDAPLMNDDLSDQIAASIGLHTSARPDLTSRQGTCISCY